MINNDIQHFRHSELLVDLVHEVVQFGWRAGVTLSVSTALALSCAFYYETLRGPSLATAGVLGAAGLALATYLSWKQSVCGVALRSMRKLESTQPPKLTGPRLELYRDAWAMARGHFGDLPELPFS
jgi:hypothetical protein